MAGRPVSKKKLQEMIRVARESAAQAYAPYSEYPVGAAVVSADGTIFGGCNVENACYGLGNCAERTAVFSAVHSGHRDLRCVVLYTPTVEPITPCGACRQVLNEFNADMRVVCVCDGKGKTDTTIREMLPGAFGPHNLG